jgi:hypothetical protein
MRRDRARTVLIAAAVLVLAPTAHGGAHAADCATQPPVPVPATAVPVCVEIAGVMGTCWISTVQTLDPINQSWDVYISYRGDTRCAYTDGTPMQMGFIENVVAPQHCSLVRPDDPTSTVGCREAQGNYGSISMHHELLVQAPGGAVRCYDCKGDLFTTETLHRMKALNGTFSGVSANCRYSLDMTFAECETSDYATTSRDYSS